jgi:LEA14-like dessication related protein
MIILIMFIGSRRVILIAVIGAIVAFIVLFPAIPDLLRGGNDLKSVNISVENIAVENSSIINNTIPLKVTFKVLNEDSKALTTSKIEFTVNANNTHLGNGIISYEDIPPNGRPQLYPKAPTTLQSTVLLGRSSINSQLFDNLHSGNFAPNNTKWNVNGTAEVDSAFTIYPVKFNSELG